MSMKIGETCRASFGPLLADESHLIFTADISNVAAAAVQDTLG